MKTCLQTIIFSIVFCALHVSAREPNSTQLKQLAQSSSLSFVENAGQIIDQHNNLRKDIDYKLNAPGMDIFIGDGEVHYQFLNHNSQDFIDNHAKENLNKPGLPFTSPNPGSTTIYRLDVSLVGANKNAKVIAEEPQEYYERYYTMPSNEDGLVARSYKKITYQNIYTNIDWVFYISNDALKYDFVVRAGGKVSDIKLKYDGASSLTIKDGALTAVTPFGSITEQKPYSYEAGSKKEVGTEYVLRDNVLGFATGNYMGELVIDPTVDWATYHGHSYIYGLGVSVDNVGNSYMGGYAGPASNIATAGAHQTVANSIDGFLVKFNRHGVRQWGTYYGGAGGAPDYINDVACGLGIVYVTGQTASTTHIATAGSFQPNYTPGPLAAYNDAFLAQFDTNGVRQWATYYGGSGHDFGYGVAVDQANNVCMVGTTTSGTLPMTPGAHQVAHGGGGDGFIAKFSPSGARLWDTYYGGIGGDEAVAVTCDNAGNFYVYGFTESASGIATPGSHQFNLSGIHNDAFLVKLNANGVRQWGTYYGGPETEYVAVTNIHHNGMAYDQNGAVLITGSTTSSSGISTPGAFKTSKTGNNDNGFLAKFNVTGQLLWGTYYGDSHGSGNGIGVSSTGLIYLCGTTTALSGIATPGGYQTSSAGNNEMFLAVFAPGGQRLEGTYFGAAGADVCIDAHRDIFGNIYMAGYSNSSNLATPNAHQTTFSGGWSSFLLKWKDTTPIYMQQPDTAFCKGQSFQLHYGVPNHFYPGNIFSVQLSNATGSFASPTVIGTLTASSNGIINCVIPSGVAAGSGYRIRIVGSSPVTTSANNGFDIKILDNPTLALSSNTPICGNTTINLTAGSSIPTVSYSWTGPNNFSTTQQNPVIPVTGHNQAGYYVATVSNQGCVRKDSTLVQIGIINPLATSNGPLCVGSTLNLFASTPSPGVSYSWNGPNSFTSTQQNPSISNVTAAATGTYTVVLLSAVCNDTLTTNVMIGTQPNVPTAGSNSPVCAGQNINLTAFSSTAGTTYSWTGPGSYNTNVQNPTRANATVAMSGTYSVTATLNGCSAAPVSTNVVVSPNPPPPTATNNSPICAGNALDLFATGLAGATYQWNGPGSYSTTMQNPTRLNVTTSHAGSYTVTQTVSGCTSLPATTTVVINNAVSPSVVVYPNPNDSICPGTLVTFVAVPVNGGTPQYRWYRNSLQIPGATNSTYQTSNVSTGDFFSVEMTSTQPCATPTTANSSNVTMTVVQPVVPSVTITASPGLNVGPWRMITFTAHPVNGGPSPTYQWLRNGQHVIGAISATWGAANLSDNDVISVVLFSSEICAIPRTDTSNAMTVHINMGIDDADNISNMQLYPNPNNGDFTVKGSVHAKDVLIEVVNAIGQVVYSSSAAEPGRASSQEFEHNIHLDVASGVYLLRVKSEKDVETFKFNITAE